MGEHRKQRSPAPLLGVGVLSLTLGIGLSLWGGPGDRGLQAADTTLVSTATSDLEGNSTSMPTEVTVTDASNPGSPPDSSDGNVIREEVPQDGGRQDDGESPGTTRPAEPETGRGDASRTTSTSTGPSTTSVPEITPTTEGLPTPPPAPTSTLPQPPPAPTSTLPQPPPLPTTTLPQPPPVP